MGRTNIRLGLSSFARTLQVILVLLSAAPLPHTADGVIAFLPTDERAVSDYRLVGFQAHACPREVRRDESSAHQQLLAGFPCFLHRRAALHGLRGGRALPEAQDSNLESSEDPELWGDDAEPTRRGFDEDDADFEMPQVRVNRNAVLQLDSAARPDVAIEVRKVVQTAARGGLFFGSGRLAMYATKNVDPINAGTVCCQGQ
jgi:hypothetical protein